MRLKPKSLPALALKSSILTEAFQFACDSADSQKTQGNTAILSYTELTGRARNRVNILRETA